MSTGTQVASRATASRVAPGPGWVPDVSSQGAIEREPLWYAHALGADGDLPPWLLQNGAGSLDAPVVPGPPQLLAQPGDGLPWPAATHRELERPASGPDGLARLVAAAMTPLRRDPHDPFKDHRGYPSPRGLFPVRAVVSTQGRWHLADPAGRRLVDTGVATDAAAVALTGRYSDIPDSYGWFAGSLLAIESGILLRHYALLSQLSAMPLTVRLPGSCTSDLMPPESLWARPRDYSPPLLLQADASAGTPADHAVASPPGVPAQGSAHPSPGRPLWTADRASDTRRIYGSHDLGRSVSTLGPATPARWESPDGADWAEVLWRRSAGRMPRGLFGFRVADRGLLPAALLDQARWAAVRPPGSLHAVHQGFTVRAVVRDVAGHRPGIYRADAGELTLESADSRAAEAISAAYGYQRSALVSSDIDRAPVVWFVTVRPRDVVRELGPGGWTAIHLASGWLTQGLCLAAAAHRLLARPVRAFDERVVADALSLEPEEMVAIAVIIGRHHPHGGLQMDLRS